MAFEAVPASRATRHELPDGLELSIPAKRNFFVIAFLSFWLIGWGVGEVSVAGHFLFGKDGRDGSQVEQGGSGSARHRSEPKVFLIAWLGGWTIGGGCAMLAWSWLVAGRERIRLTPTALTVRREVFGLGRSRDYDLAHARSLRVVPGRPESNRGNQLEVWGLGGGPIAFDYGSSTHHFGAGLDEAEAKTVVRDFVRRAPSLDRGNDARE